jgi:hypothetical protein
MIDGLSSDRAAATFDDGTMLFVPVGQPNDAGHAAPGRLHVPAVHPTPQRRRVGFELGDGPVPRRRRGTRDVCPGKNFSGCFYRRR